MEKAIRKLYNNRKSRNMNLKKGIMLSKEGLLTAAMEVDQCLNIIIRLIRTKFFSKMSLSMLISRKSIAIVVIV